MAVFLAAAVGVGVSTPGRAFAPGGHGHGPERPDFDRRPHPTPPAQVGPAAAAETARASALTKLQQLQPGLRVQFDARRGTPKSIANPRGFLTGPGGEGRTVTAGRAQAFARSGHPPVRAFLAEHAALFGHGPEILDDAGLERSFVARHNGLRTVVWRQRVDGIDVDDGVLIGHETARGELVSISSLMMPNARRAVERGTPQHAAGPAAPPLPAAEAILIAAGQVGEAVAWGEVMPLGPSAGADLRQTFRAGAAPGETRARLIWLPLDESSLRLCWAVEISSRAGGERFRVVIDAINGDVLVRKRLTLYLSEASYRVFTGDSPTPFSPGWASPNSNQPPTVARSMVTWSALNTNASPLGWIADGENETRGNNVDAHTDADADDAPDLPRPRGNPFRVFDPPLDLTQAPEFSADAATVQLFYWCNWTHDRLYELGFDEASGNYQKDNLGRGGLGGDAIAADAQDGSGVNNANFTPSPDGEPGRIQMFVWSGPNPDRDGDFDGEIVIHEYVHGLSTRLVGGGVGISTVQAAGLGEGWSDFYALALLSESGDDPEAAYAFGAYASHQLAGLTESYYFGIRQYPYSTDLNRNPLTWKDIDPTQASPHTGVPRSPISPFNPVNASEVHAQGEVWCVTLWEARANLIRRFGPEAGNRLMLQLVTDGMKLSPPNPDFLQARDAILLADQLNHGGIHHPDLWRAFAKRGLGFSARGPDSTTTIGVEESFDLPDDLFLLTAAGLFASGPPGGPFVPACQSFTITNLSAKPIRWAAASLASWLRISPERGTLAAGGTLVVTACVNSNAATLPVGTYAHDLVFANLDSGVNQTRPVELRVMLFRGLPLAEDFEAGELEDFWASSGTGRNQARVSDLNGPHAGRYHLILDADGGVRSRNELTVGLDLAGYTNVTLRFWARSFGDEPDAPPPGPIVGGADFDGVAISDDGVLWHEVASLRDIPFDYTEFTVDLDAAIAAHGLRYTPEFRLRFNQVDDFQVPFDGIALDDISLTGIPAKRLQVSAPARATEGAGALTEQGSIQIGLPASGDLTIFLSASHPDRVTVPSSITIPAGATNASFAVTVLDNARLDGTDRVRLTATAPGYASGFSRIDVVDNETATLRVSVPARVREGDGVLRRQGTITASSRPVRDVSITVTSSVPGVVQVPRSVILPTGRKSVDFDLNVLDDGHIDGPRRAVVTAFVENWTAGTDSTLVVENDSPGLTLELPPAIAEGNGTVTNAAFVRLSGLLPTNVVISLSSSDASELRVPATLEIPAGQIRASFELTALNDSNVDGPKSVRLTARSTGFAGDAGALVVLDDETPPAPFLPRPAHGATQVPVSLTLEWGTGYGERLVNGGFETGDFSGWVTTNSGFGAWYLADAEFDPEGPDGPGAPLEGKHHVTTAQNGAGWHLLYQDVFIPPDAPSAAVAWTDRIRNHADYFSTPNQEFKVEIRDTNDLVLATLFRTRPGDTNFQATARRSFDVSRFRGRTVRLAFVQQDNLGYLNVAIDDVGLQLGTPVEPTEFSVYLSTSPTPGPANLLGTTTNGYWALPRLALNSTYYWQVSARRGASAVRGPVWRFSTRGIGAIDHFEFGLIASPQQAGQRFPVVLTARDDIGNAVPGFRGPARLAGAAGTGTRSQVLITEVDVGPKDQVEFANVTSEELDLSGWMITLYDAPSWPAPLTTFTIPNGTRCRPAEHFVLNDEGLEPGEFPRFNAGTNVSWNATAFGNPIAVLLRDAGGSIVDFMAAGDASSERLTNPVAIPISEWSGPAALVTGIATSGFTLQRQGQADSDSAADWAVAENSYGARNPALGLPFAPRGRIEVTPTNLTNFGSGVWIGYVTIGKPADAMVLTVTDAAGHRGISKSFAVGIREDLAVRIDASPNVTLLGNSLTYRVAVTNTGPSPASGVLLTNWLPENVRLVSAATFSGTCTVQDSIVVCELDPIRPGDSARVALTVETIEPGQAVFRAATARSGAETFVDNNIASIQTTITGPSIAATSVNLAEGSTSTNVARINVLLSGPCRLPVSVAYTTSNITAQAGDDYVATSGTLVFPPGSTNLAVNVPIVPDRMDEGSEQFALVLDHPTNGVIVVPPPRCRIQDDDPPPSMTVTDALVTEGAFGISTEAVFRVQLSAPSALNVRVNYSTADDSAQAPLDYRAIAGTLQFPAGVTNQFIRVLVRGDQRYEPEERFFLRFSLAEASVLVRTQAVGRILDDDADEVDAFEWSSVPSPQFAGFPFATTLTARDGLGRVATNHSGKVDLSAVAEKREIISGIGTNGWNAPFGTFFHDQRTQILFPPETLGGAGTLNAITLDLLQAPGQTLSNWTIRLKPTGTLPPVANWETSGWVTVYQKDENILEAGPVTFFLQTPFVYDGTNSLWVDFSFNNGSYSTDGLVRSTDSGQLRTLVFQTDSAFGDPRGWNGRSPPPVSSSRVPNLGLQFERPLRIIPSTSLELARGVWTGPVTVEEPGQSIVLRANDGLGRAADSNPFDVVSGLDANADGIPDQWEQAYFGGVGTVDGHADADPDRDGLNNAAEFRAGSDPRSAASTVAFSAVERQGNQLRLRFATLASRRYWIEQRSIDRSGEWREIQGPIMGDGSERTVGLALDPSGPAQLLRLRVAP